MSQISDHHLERRLDRIRDPPGGWPPSPVLETSNVRSEPHSLAQAVKARKDEYIRKKSIKIKVGSWNVAAISGTEKDLGAWFVDGKGVKGLSQDLSGLSADASRSDDRAEENIESVADQERRKSRKSITIPKNDVPAVPGGDEIGLYVLGLQEVIDISSASSALRPYVDPDPGKKWKRAMEHALPPGYVKVAEQQLLGLLILAYASPEVAPSISCVSTSSVGTGLMGYLGNKGAVSVRIVLGETTRLVFVNCHLSAGSDKAALGRRNWDMSQILSRTTFAPITDGYETEDGVEEKIGDEDFAFWFGDLNYRLEDIPGEDVRRLLLLHTRNEYDIENKSSRKIDSELGYVEASARDSSSEDTDRQTMISQSTLENGNVDTALDPLSDPTSLQTTLQSLLPHDQLRSQQKQYVAFHDGWQEGEINFLPTYKYDIGSVGMFDSGEKRRSPSWCDRILFRSRESMLKAQRRAREAAEARKKDAEMKARGVDEAASEEGVLFDYDPDADALAYGDDYDEGEDVLQATNFNTNDDEPDKSIIVDHYVSHQRVLSSDHKPLDAVFTVHYNAAIPELKAKVQQEVARSLDKAENEGRPTVTVVVDNQPEDKTVAANDSTDQSNIGSIDFGHVRYKIPTTRSLTIANTGQIPANFTFVERPVADGHDGSIAPPWLNIKIISSSNKIISDPSTSIAYTLFPGETTTVRLTLNISDPSTVRDLNKGKLNFDEILVLRIIDGRDHFLPVRGTWLRTCFCCTLDELSSLPPGGIRSLKIEKTQIPLDSNTSINTPNRAGDGRSAPRALAMLTEGINQLSERSIAEWDMVHEHELPPWKWQDSTKSWPFDSQTWTLSNGLERSEYLSLAIEAIDDNLSFDKTLPNDLPSLVRLEILSEILLEFLQSLQDGVITTELWTEIETQMITREKLKDTIQDHEQAWIMDILTSKPVHAVAFTYIISMLNKLLSELAPVSYSSSAIQRSPRASTSSLRSTESDLSEVAISIPSSDNGRTPKSFLSSFTRRDRSKTASSSSGEANEVTAALERRKGIEQAYTDRFSNVLIRSKEDQVLKGREKNLRLLDARKKRVLAAFLSTSSGF